MKWAKYFLAACGYLLAFCLLVTIFTQVIDSFITGEQIQSLARLFGIQDIEDTLDLYVDASITVSALLAVGTILLCRLYIQRRLRAIDNDTK